MKRPSALGLVRFRLRLALLTTAVAPVAVAIVLFNALLTWMATDEHQQVGSDAALAASYVVKGADLPLFLAAAVGVPAVMVLLLVLWMSRQILRPAEELERSRSEMRRLYEIAKADSLRDGLTGLGNHRAFQEELERQLEWFQRYKVPIALLVIDLDDLKLVNDSEGHAAGDDMLRDMGRLIVQVTRYADRPFRVGGDEFAILLPHTDAEGAMKIARRLQERAAQLRPGGRKLAFSGGISACPALAGNRSQLYAQADAALYWCKRHGRASVDVFHPVRDRAASSQEATSELSASIARVVTERLLRPVYQPIVDLATGRVIGFEGLIRPDPESGFPDPGTMFSAAETVGRTVELDQACLHAVIAGARTMPADQLLTINVSPRTIEAPHFSTEALLVTLARYAIPPERVVVELTEREKVEDIGRLQANLGALQRAGMRIAADDVGAGNAGLRLLSQFRFDIVKIDLSLVQEGAERDSSRAVLRSLRDLASRWGAAVIAEGIETVSQLTTVRELGMTAGQGYLLGRPMSAPALTSIDIASIDVGGLVLERPVVPAPFATYATPAP
jgi:diguanylate cyclase (GGDEF)-like protein